jgi:hypothetical protein
MVHAGSNASNRIARRAGRRPAPRKPGLDRRQSAVVIPCFGGDADALRVGRTSGNFGFTGSSKTAVWPEMAQFVPRFSALQDLHESVLAERKSHAPGLNAAGTRPSAHRGLREALTHHRSFFLDEATNRAFEFSPARDRMLRCPRERQRIGRGARGRLSENGPYFAGDFYRSNRESCGVIRAGSADRRHFSGGVRVWRRLGE